MCSLFLDTFCIPENPSKVYFSTREFSICLPNDIHGLVLLLVKYIYAYTSYMYCLLSAVLECFDFFLGKQVFI
jgi:hypothetical protein